MPGEKRALQERLRKLASTGPVGPARAAPPFDEDYLIRCLAYLLRHSSNDRGVVLDSRGWASVDEVSEATRRMHWSLGDLTAEHVIEFVQRRGSDRFEVYGARVRARYGHSTEGLSIAEPEIPLEILFHGTTRAVVELVRQLGLKPMGRSHVHLTSDLAYAGRVARAAGGDWIVLSVRARQAAGAGTVFRKASGHVWLSDAIDPSHIDEHAIDPPACTEAPGHGKEDSRNPSAHIEASCPMGQEDTRSLERLGEGARVMMHRAVGDGCFEPFGPETETPCQVLPREEKT